MDGQPLDISHSHHCTICLTSVVPGESARTCPDCGALHHEECWQENGGCGVYGCKAAPTPEPRQAIEIPMSHWGREQKNCPACGGLIQAAAVRCKHCGNTFDATPVEAATFRAKKAQTGRLPAVRRAATIVAGLCLFPFTAPLGILVGLVWIPLRWRDLSALSGLYRTLICVSYAMAIIIVAGLLIVMRLHYQTNAPLDF